MAKQPAKNVKIMVSAVALEDDCQSFSLDITQETPVVTSLGDAGPRRVVGNYDFGANIGGASDLAIAQSDATLFGLIGSAGVAVQISPTGAVAGPNDPKYASNMVLSNYRIDANLGEKVAFSANLQANSILARVIDPLFDIYDEGDLYDFGILYG